MGDRHKDPKARTTLRFQSGAQLDAIKAIASLSGVTLNEFVLDAVRAHVTRKAHRDPAVNHEALATGLMVPK